MQRTRLGAPGVLEKPLRDGAAQAGFPPLLIGKVGWEKQWGMGPSAYVVEKPWLHLNVSAERHTGSRRLFCPYRLRVRSAFFVTLQRLKVACSDSLFRLSLNAHHNDASSGSALPLSPNRWPRAALVIRWREMHRFGAAPAKVRHGETQQIGG